MAYDRKCYELAEAFLDDDDMPTAMEMHRQKLAQRDSGLHRRLPERP